MAFALRAALPVIEALFVPGLLLTSLLLGAPFVRGAETSEWGLFLALGTLFPLGVVALAGLPAVESRLGGFARAGRIAAGLAAVGLGGFLLVAGTSPAVLAIAGVHGLVLAGWQLRRAGIRNASPMQPERLFRGAGHALALALGWSAAAKLVYWRPLHTMVTESAAAMVIFVVAVALGSWFVAFEAGATPAPAARRRRHPILLATSALVILVLAFNTGALFDDWAMAHWFWALGPSQLVRDGGWLLWDVHSTYGFLNALIVAALPFASTWQSFYVVNACLLAISAGIVLQLLREGRGKGPGVALAALVLTVSAVFLLPGETHRLSGIQVWPSVGPFRFLWCFVLLGILWWNHARLGAPDGAGGAPGLRNVAWLGSGAWVLGCLWSLESAAYCTAIWWPAYVLLVGQATLLQDESAPRAALAWLALPLAMLAGAWGLVASYFWIFLGVAPDPLVFVGPALAFTVGGTNNRLIDEAGPLWVLVLALGIVSTLAARLIARGPGSLRALSVVAGAFGAVWSTSSYFVNNSHPAHPLNLAPIWIASFALVLGVLRREDLDVRASTAIPSTAIPSTAIPSTAIRLAMAPLLAVTIFATFGNVPALGEFASVSARSFARDFRPFPDIESRLLPPDPEVQELVTRAKVAAGDPITSLGVGRDEPSIGLRLTTADGASVRVYEPPALLPLNPAWAFSVLPPERRAILMRRWIERQRRSGWILAPADTNFAIVKSLQVTHRITERFRSERFLLLRFESRRRP